MWIIGKNSIKHLKKIIEKKNFYSHLNMEDIADADYASWNIWAWFLTDINMLLTLEKGVRGGISHSVSWYVKNNTKYMKYHHKK